MSDWQEAEQRVERARSLFEQRRWKEALSELQAAIAINPYNASWFFNIGLTLDELEQFDDAIDAYHKALEIDPDDLQTLDRLGLDLCRTGDFAGAVHIFQQIEQVDATFEPGYCHRIIAYTELGEHELAEEMFYLARLYKEDCPDCYYNIGRSLALRGSYDKAIYCWQRTADLEPEYPEVHLRIAEAFRAKGRLEQARRHYLLAIRQDPGSVQTLLDLGDLLLEMRRLDEAGEKFRRAIELSPNEPAGYLSYGRWLMQCGRLDEAAESFNRTLKLEPRYPWAHLRLAEVYHIRGRLESAKWHLRRELLLRPQEPALLRELGRLLLDCSDHRTAVACLKRLVTLDPETVPGWQNLAVAQFALGHMRDGIASCYAALRRSPDNPITHYNLALAHERMRQYERALLWTRRGLEFAPNDPSLKQLLTRIRLLRWVRGGLALFGLH